MFDYKSIHLFFFFCNSKYKVWSKILKYNIKLINSTRIKKMRNWFNRSEIELTSRQSTDTDFSSQLDMNSKYIKYELQSRKLIHTFNVYHNIFFKVWVFKHNILLLLKIKFAYIYNSQKFLLVYQRDSNEPGYSSPASQHGYGQQANQEIYLGIQQDGSQYPPQVTNIFTLINTFGTTINFMSLKNNL